MASGRDLIERHPSVFGLCDTVTSILERQTQCDADSLCLQRVECRSSVVKMSLAAAGHHLADDNNTNDQLSAEHQFG